MNKCNKCGKELLNKIFSLCDDCFDKGADRILMPDSSNHQLERINKKLKSKLDNSIEETFKYLESLSDEELKAELEKHGKGDIYEFLQGFTPKAKPEYLYDSFTDFKKKNGLIIAGAPHAWDAARELK